MDITKYRVVLWDVPEKTTELDEEFVIKRTLSFGGIFLIKDLVDSLGIDYVHSVFDSMKPTEMPSRRYKFFKDFFFV